MDKFLPGVGSELKYYVYRLIDPRDGQTFYVGKGQDDRVFAHIQQSTKLGQNHKDDDLKRDIIGDIVSDGLEVIHVIHRHGIEDEQTAFLVESVLIDAYPGLTNKTKGKGSREYGSTHAKVLNRRHAPDYIDFGDDPTMVIKVNQESIDSKNGNIYEATRGGWEVSGPRVNGTPHIVLSILIPDNRCIGVFQVDANSWRTCDYNRRRMEFDGREANDEVRSRYLDKFLPEGFNKRGAQKPFRYSNF